AYRRLHPGREGGRGVESKEGGQDKSDPRLPLAQREDGKPDQEDGPPGGRRDLPPAGHADRRRRGQRPPEKGPPVEPVQTRPHFILLLTVAARNLRVRLRANGYTSLDGPSFTRQ